MFRFNVMHMGLRRGLATAVGIGGILALSIGTGTLHAQAVITPAASTTMLSSSSPANASAPGASVVLTASIVPSGTSPVTPTGTVQFKDGSSNLGSVVTVTAGTSPKGTASSPSITTLAAGSHSLTAVYNGDAASAASTSAVLTQLISPNANFIHAAYQTMLAHDGNAAGLAYWVNQLDNLKAPRSDLASYLASTPEYRNLVIAGNGQSGSDFYDLYLKRPFDANGASFWVGQMANGMTFEQVRLRFAGSPEFFSSPNVGKNDKATAIEALYVDLLGRASDTAGKTYWMANFDATHIAAQFLFSQEGRSFLVNNLYGQILGHSADSGGLTYWTNALLGGASDEQIIASILSSDEYFTKNH
jgi:hypothetical protein